MPNEHGLRVLVDYAHTEDALIKVLDALRELSDGRLICVFGCGGDRDRGKRAPMGRAVGERADLAILTSDNPRGEDPGRIAADVLAGLAGARAEVLVEPDRERAIRRAIELARRGDLVLIAGKGHETTQTVGGVALPFDDRLVAAACLRARGEAP